MDSAKLREIDEFAQQKEKEWKHATSLQISSLQSALSEKEREHRDLFVKFLKLKEDFKYNLKLLQERDKELKQYDESFTNTKALESVHTAEISDLRIKIAAIQESLDREKYATCEMQKHYRQRLIDQQAEMEAFKSAKDAEVEETVSQLSQLKIRHDRTESQLQSEIESQRIELNSELEDALKQKDREVMEKQDKMKTEVLEHQLKAKLIEKELQLVKSAQEKQAETLGEADETGTKLKKKLQEAQWEIKDVSSLKNARILELEAKNQNLQAKIKTISGEYEHKHQELDRNMRTKQANIDSARQTFVAKEQGYEEEIRKLQSKIDSTEHETSRALWDKNDLKKEQEVKVSSLNREIDDLKLRLENQVKDHSTAVVSKDVEIQNMRNREDLMKCELEKLKDDIDKYKRELASATQKENLLLQSKVQLKIDWQQRCEEVERKQYEKSEELIVSLTKSRDVALAEVKRLRREMGLDVQDEEGKEVLYEDNQLQDLVEQNNQLKVIIQKMTEDVQQLAGSKGTKVEGNDVQGSPSMKITPQYIKSLEDELLLLRRENRKLEKEEKQAQESSNDKTSSKPLPTPVMPTSFAHPDVTSHINYLNQTIGNLRSEKLDATTQLQKAQVRLRHQGGLLTTRESDLKKQLGRIQELEYELMSYTRRTEQETESQKRRISDLELLLAEARREADEYYRGGIQNNLRATELGNKISQMTVQNVAKNSAMSGIVQNGLVQQLQLEITELRRELTKAKQSLILGKSESRPTKVAAMNKQLHAKLRLAAEQISNLLQEKSRLLESGNSLRAELATYKKMHPEEKYGEEQERTSAAVNQGDGDGSRISNKLKQMEDLQYQLTRQELQYAQRLSPRKPIVSQKEMETPQTTSTPTDDRMFKSVAKINGVISSGSLSVQPLQYSLSSVGDGSMNEVWNMLDQAPSSPSVPGSREDSVIGTGNNDNTKAGHTPQKVSVRAKSKENYREGPRVKSKARHRAPRIRNYNVKDDSEARFQQNSEKRNFH